MAEYTKINIVDIVNLKREIQTYMSTGFTSDDLVCKEIMKLIDRHCIGEIVWK
jgi:hypothetical protein